MGGTLHQPTTWLEQSPPRKVTKLYPSLNTTSAQGQPRSSKPLLRTPQSGWNWKLSFESTKYSYLLFFAGKSLKQARWQYLVNLIDMWPSFSFVAELWRVLVKGVQDRYMPFFKKIYGRADCMSPFQLSSRQSGFCSCLARIFKKKKK